MAERVDSRPRSTENETSEGQSLGMSIGLFALIFGLFVAGLYVLSLYTLSPVYFLVGLAMVIVSLFLVFDLVPRMFSN